MGNQTQNNVSNFPIQNYLNRGASKQEVIMIRKIWDQLNPNKQVVNVQNIIGLYKNNKSISRLQSTLGSKKTINFQQFFQIFSKNLIQQKRKLGGQAFCDTSMNDTSCGFCPYSKDTGKTIYTI